MGRVLPEHTASAFDTVDCDLFDWHCYFNGIWPERGDKFANFLHVSLACGLLFLAYLLTSGVARELPFKEKINADKPK